MLCQYTSPGKFYYIFSVIPSSCLEASPSSFSCFLSWLLFLFLIGLSYFQAVHHMWRRSWVRNEHFINFPFLFFIVAHKCIIAKEELVMMYLFSDIRLLLFFFFIVFLFLPADLFFVTLLMTVYALFPVIIRSVTFFNGVSILFAVLTLLVLFYFHTISSIVPIFTLVVALSLDLTYV